MDATPQFERAKREHDAKPLTFEVEGDQFSLHPKLGTRALEAVGRATKEDPSAMFDFLRAQFAGDGDYERFLDLDLDIEDELPGFVEFILGLYGDPGKSSGSPEPSESAGTS
jgi:hypothetical protein